MRQAPRFLKIQNLPNLIREPSHPRGIFVLASPPLLQSKHKAQRQHCSADTIHESTFLPCQARGTGRRLVRQVVQTERERTTTELASVP